LYADPRIFEAAAVAVPDARLGELPAAVVSLTPGTVTPVSEHDIADGVRSRLPPHAMPVMILISDGPLEHNVAGKIDKQEIRRIAREEWTRRSQESPVHPLKGKL